MADAHIDTLDHGTPRERVALATGVALLLAGVVLVIAVLPAEYGVDPVGLGHRLGLTAMSDLDKQLRDYEQSKAGAASTQATVVAQEKPYQQETIDFALGPGEFIEYKYRLEKGEALLFSWKATAPVTYEFHAEPDGAPRGYAESYEKKDGVPAESGTLTAPFPGIHGWYWLNPTREEVTVTLSTAGFYNMAHEFRKDVAPKAKMFP